MSGQVQWSPKLPFETIVRYADFADELAAGESITLATTIVQVWSGNDPSPAIILGTTVVANSAGINTVAAVNLQLGVLGTIYQCSITGQTSLGRVIIKSAAIAIRPPFN